MLALYFSTSLFFFMIGIASFFLDFYIMIFLLVIVTIICLFVSLFFGKRTFMFVFLAFVFFCFGYLRSNNYFANSFLIGKQKSDMCFVEELKRNYNKIDIFLFCPGYGKIYFYQDKANDNLNLSDGDAVTITGNLVPIYNSKKNKDKYFYELKGKIEKKETYNFKKPIGIRTKIFFKNLNNRLQKTLETIYPEPHSSIIGAILLGNKNNIDRIFADQFAKAGISHIMVVSGFHIMIIAQMLNKFFRGLGKKHNLFLTMIFLVFFVLLIGANTSAIRAVIMAFVLLLAERSGRDYYPLTSILLAASIMVYFNPYILLYDIGFQLSFSAVIGIIYLRPSIMSFFKTRGYFIEILSVTLAAQLSTLPLIIYYFENISLYGIFANLVIVPLLPLLMFLSVCSLFIAFIKIELTFIFGFLSWLVVQFILLISQIADSVGFYSIDWGQSVIAFLVFIMLLCFKLGRLKYEE